MLDKVYALCINERPTTIITEKEWADEARKSGFEVLELVSIDDVIAWLQDRQPVWIEFKNEMGKDNEQESN